MNFYAMSANIDIRIVKNTNILFAISPSLSYKIMKYGPKNIKIKISYFDEIIK